MKNSYFNGFLVVAFVLMLFTSKVYAHNALVSSVPANDAAVATATELKLGFNAPVRLVRLTMTGADNKEVGLDFSPDTVAKQDYAVALPGLSAGMYTVNWALIGADGHTVGDKFSFNVDPSLAASAGNANHAAHADHADHAGHATHATHADDANHAGHAGDAAHGDHHGAPAATAAPAADHQH
jgi:methionine-rich copper-binding protein CopC